MPKKVLGESAGAGEGGSVFRGMCVSGAMPVRRAGRGSETQKVGKT